MQTAQATSVGVETRTVRRQTRWYRQHMSEMYDSEVEWYSVGYFLEYLTALATMEEATMEENERNESQVF